jgi:hypothetical protein
MKHLAPRESYRAKLELGERVEDAMYAESDPWLSPSARAYVIEVIAARAQVLAARNAGEKQRGEPRCRLCGSVDLKWSWELGGGRECRACGATNYRLLTGVPS